MGVSTTAGTAAVLAGVVLAGVSSPVAGATADWGLNGSYTATSNGEWAKTNDIYQDQASKRATWIITTTCSYPSECTGTVDSDWGWSAPLYMTGGVWYLKRALENWQPCADGTAGPGLQVFRFYPATPDGSGSDPASTTLLGEDSTTGASGSCGSSKVVFITMPFRLVKA